MQIHAWVMMGLVLGCKGEESNGKDDSDSQADSPSEVDSDADGVSVEEGDCDDDNEWIFPGRAEDCDGIDDNCNGVIDEGFTDVDDDGIADCVDEEECDGVDNDGDGQIDEGFDTNGDGIPDCPTEEICDGLDNDDDGLVDEDFDVDGDGFAACGERADCDDADPAINPDAVEVAADLVDNDCDHLIDEGLWAPGDLVITEVMFNPNAVSDLQGEWFEVTNVSGRLVSLNGLEVLSAEDGIKTLMADGPVLVPAGAAAVVGINADASTNGGVDVDIGYDSVSLSNESDDLALFADGVLLDRVSWDDGATMPDPSGSSLSLAKAHIDAALNDDPSVWCVSSSPWGDGTDWGSPGQQNQPCPQFDDDGDGWSGLDGDCDDTDPSVYPGAPETDVGVDNDCDGIEAAAPVAFADYSPESSSFVVGGMVYLDGSGSFDPDGGGLYYAWSMDDAPDGSSAYVISPSSSMAYFYPDAAGTYNVSLVVSDGTLESSPSRITFEIE